MNNHIRLDNFFTRINEVDIIIYVYPDGEEITDKPLKRYFFPMSFLEDEGLWSFDLEAYNLSEFQILYQFWINKKFMINQVNSDYEIVHNELLSVRHPVHANFYYETDVEVKSQYTYTTFADRVNRKFSFLPSESKVELGVELNNASNILLQIEWLDPADHIYSITEHTVEAKQELHSFILLQQNYEVLYGQWTVNLYTSGQKLSSTSFIVTQHDKYKINNHTSLFDRLL
jgi:hypothetical protein